MGKPSKLISFSFFIHPFSIGFGIHDVLRSWIKKNNPPERTIWYGQEKSLLVKVKDTLTKLVQELINLNYQIMNQVIVLHQFNIEF